MKFKEFINESKVITYHGGDTILDFGKDTRYMMTKDSNNQEGVGHYFGSFATAETYGKNIIKTEIDSKNYIDSRKDIRKYINIKQIVNILTDMYKANEEAMYYMITDWGVEISEPEDIEEEHIEFLANKMQNEEVRNFQITMAQEFGVIDFVESWNKHCKNIHGTFQKQGNGEVWYCIINTKQKVQKV